MPLKERSVPMTFKFGRCDFQIKIHVLLPKGERMNARQATTADTQFFSVSQLNISSIIYWDPTHTRQMARNFELHEDE